MTKKSYWHGYAPGYSIDVERAADKVMAAKAALRDALERAYPLNAMVRVVHPRGCFYGTVVGWDRAGARVVVRNAGTGKSKGWWAAHVEIADTARQGQGDSNG